MKYLHLILIILGLLSGGYTSTAQESQFSVIYDFHVHNREELQDGKIKIEVFKGGLNTFFGVALDHIEMDIQDSITRVEVPIPEKINYLRLGVFFGRLEGAYSLINLNVNNNLFLVEDSDTVEIHLYPKEISDVVFRGHYAQKYDLQYTLSNQRNISNGINETYLSILKQKRYDEAFSFWLSRAEHQAKKLNDKVDSSAINPVIKRIFKYDNLASLYNAYRTILEGALEVLPYDQNMTEIAKRKLTEPFQKLNDNDDEWKAWSMLWCDMLLFKERLLWLIKNHPAQVADVTVYDGCIADIAKKYRGSIRDKLFYLALLRKWDNAGLRNIGEPLMGDNIYSNAYKSLRIRSDGGKVFDAVFYDEDNNERRFSEFEGKVLVIDMWYTGCIPCRYLARELKEIKKEMKSSEDVLFVSLSFDKYRDVWLESLKSGEYTHEDGVNLWIGEKATKHPIVEYYGIFGYPTLLIVDREGNLAERNPPRPVYTDPHSRVIFKSLIQKYR